MPSSLSVNSWCRFTHIVPTTDLIVLIACPSVKVRLDLVLNVSKSGLALLEIKISQTELSPFQHTRVAWGIEGGKPLLFESRVNGTEDKVGTRE
jgi:hypothetical protein